MTKPILQNGTSSNQTLIRVTEPTASLVAIENTNPIASSAKQLSEVDVMDRAIYSIELNRADGTATLNARYNAYADDRSNGLSPMERDLLRLQIEDPFLWESKEIKDYQCTRGIYEKNNIHKTSSGVQPRFQLCHYLSPKIAAIDDFLCKIRSAPLSKETIQQYEQTFTRLFQAVLTGQGSFNTDSVSAEKYKNFFNKQINELQESYARNKDGDVLQCKIIRQAIENYYDYHLLPKELLRYGLILGPSHGVTKGRVSRQRYLGIAMPSLSEKILQQIPANKTTQEHRIPVYFYNSANGTLDKSITTTSFNGGMVNISLINLEAETVNETVGAKAWKQRFDKVYNENPNFKFEHDPRFLDQLLLLGFHGKNPNPDTARDRILDAHLEEQLAYAISVIYIENLFRQSLHADGTGKLGEDDSTFWAGLARGRHDYLPAIFKDNNNTTIREAYEKIDEALNIGEMDADNLDARNVKRGAGQMLNVEARLRALAKSTNPAYHLLRSLRHVIIPMEQEFKSLKGKSKEFRFGTEVILTKLLTEKLLGHEGVDLCKTVKWDELLKKDFTDFEMYSYKNFLNDPNKSSNDPHGLMKLRRAWYRFFDEKISGANYEQKLSSFIKSSLVQNAAKSLVKREFISYQDRKISEHLDYYRKHRYLGTPDKINDMVD